MSLDALATLVNVGAAGSVIAVVVLFLRFIEQRDKENRDFFASIRLSDGEASRRLTEVIERLVTRLEALEGKFDKHDATEMEFLRSIISTAERRTRPRPKTGGEETHS
jgi:hypothetical protein